MKLFDPQRPRCGDFPGVLDQHGNVVGAVPIPTVKPLSEKGHIAFELTVYVPGMRTASYRSLTCYVEDLNAFYGLFLEDPEKVLREKFKWDFAGGKDARILPAKRQEEDLSEALGL